MLFCLLFILKWISAPSHYPMICVTSVAWLQPHSAFSCMDFVFLFSQKGCAQMALTSYHIHLNPGSQLTKRAPRGCRGTDSHLLPFLAFTHIPYTHCKLPIKLAAQPKTHSPAIERKRAFPGSNTPADSRSQRLHQCFWKGLARCLSEYTLHVDELRFI